MNIMQDREMNICDSLPFWNISGKISLKSNVFK
jgi:hypothetical protein